MFGALSAPIAITGAGLAFTYAGFLLATHALANIAFAAASFGVQSFAAAVSARVLYGVGPRRALFAFAGALRPQEVLIVATTALSVLGIEARGPGAVIFVACMVWQAVEIARFFKGLGARWPRAIVATCMHYAIIALLVGAYAHAFDLFPYPPGVP